MNNQIVKIYQGVITEDEKDINLIQLCSYCKLTPEYIEELVNEGLLDPQGISKHEWRFTFTSIERVKKVKRLQRDFELNLPGVDFALHLMERIEKLESTLERLTRL